MIQARLMTACGCSRTVYLNQRLPTINVALYPPVDLAAGPEGAPCTPSPLKTRTFVFDNYDWNGVAVYQEVLK